MSIDFRRRLAFLPSFPSRQGYVDLFGADGFTWSMGFGAIPRFRTPLDAYATLVLSSPLFCIPSERILAHAVRREVVR